MARENLGLPRMRAKRACLSCNTRRVRCNVLEKQPCRNCVAWNLSCEIGPSRRGKQIPTPIQKSCGDSSDTDHYEDAGVPQIHQEPLYDSSSNYEPSIGSTTSGHSFHKTMFLGKSSALTCIL
ncbi:uncharacterized protein N7458_000518 [Penicillium daleae]|uniref:Zn(2)-C6 fungal-type domain-containing protein n=1 Tax=Penicillium daleae TaxID=63821 RepID=A0AAD6G8Y2_9EURO|nr:uncharacterized protein N7458_000518 [Penicillium daleae]KAJ5464832.1 hypothetical protein N7458_000518 [Penicillium daleae]